MFLRTITYAVGSALEGKSLVEEEQIAGTSGTTVQVDAAPLSLPKQLELNAGGRNIEMVETLDILRLLKGTEPTQKTFCITSLRVLRRRRHRLAVDPSPCHRLATEGWQCARHCIGETQPLSALYGLEMRRCQ